MATKPNPYFNDPKGDLVIRSSDGLDARVQSVKLRGVSDVFDAMFAAGTGSEQEKTADGVPLVKVEDEGVTFGRFLQFAIAPQVNSQVLELADAIKVQRLTDKYQAPVASALVVSSLHAHVDKKASTVFALAVIHGDLILARHALSEMSNKITINEDSRGRQSLTVDSLLLGDIEFDWFRRMPALAFYNYLNYARSASYALNTSEGMINTWKSLAKEYTFT